MMSLFAVLKSFIKNIMTSLGHESSTQAHIGEWAGICSSLTGEYFLRGYPPNFANIAFTDRLNERLAFVTEHLNCRPLIIYVPKYRISLTQGRL